MKLSEAEKHLEETKGILFRGAVGTAIDFQTRVVDWIMACRIEDGGIPAFRTSFAKRPFKSDKTYYVMGVCWLGSNLVRSQWFSNVPEEDWEYMHDNSDDYVYLLKKYGSAEQLNKALKAPVVVV
jgi:hypothetical protein